MVGGNRCCIALCGSHSAKAKTTGEPLRFFQFPKDKKLKQKWVQKCYRKDTINPDAAKVCSRHFVIEDFEDALRAELMNTPPRRLKSTAVPSQNLLPGKCKVLPPKERPTKYIKEKDRKALVDSLLSDVTSQQFKESQTNEKLMEETSHVSTEVEVVPCSTESLDELKEKIKTLTSENKNLLQENETLHKKMKDAEQILHKELMNVEMLKQKVYTLEKMLKESDKQAYFEEKVKTAFKDVLSTNQIEIMLKKKTKGRWTEEELNNALTLRCFGERGYSFLRDKLHYPLPGISTLKRWAGNRLGNTILVEEDDDEASVEDSLCSLSMFYTMSDTESASSLSTKCINVL